MFLQPSSQAIATDARDYPEWHHGRENYALWYIEIQNPALLDYLEQLRTQFSDVLYQPNQRQFHITLYICGFLTNQKKHWNDDFLIEQLQQQFNILSKIQLKLFRLRSHKIRSFSSALFVEVLDIEDMLKHIRSILVSMKVDIAALTYCPHITLGLYNKAYESDLIFKRIEQVQQQNFEFLIDHLTFGHYQAQTLQGQLIPHTQLQLGDACCN